MKQIFTVGLFLMSLSLFSQEYNKLIPATIKFKNGTSKSILISKDEAYNSKSVHIKFSNNASFEIARTEIIESISANDKSFFLRSYENSGKYYFLNLTVGGAADLYYYFDDTNSIRYIAYNAEYGFKELTNNKSTVNKEGREFSKNTKEYLGALSLIFSNCNKDINLKNIKLTTKSLSNSFISYNECKEDLVFKSPSLKTKNKLQITLLGGADINSLKTTTPVASKGNGETNFTIGTEFILVPAILNTKLNPFISLNYTQTGGEADYLSTPEFDKLVLDFKMIEVYTGLRYSLLPVHSKINPFIGVSMGKSFILNHENSIMKVASDNSSSSRPLYNGNPHKELGNSMKLGFHYQAGLRYRLSAKQGLIIKVDYSSMDESLGEFKFNRYRLEAGYYFDL